MDAAPNPRRRLVRPPIGFVALLMLVGGCATVRHARYAQDPANRGAGERTPTAAELGLPPAGPVALERLVCTALRVHPSVVGARRGAEGAQARMRAAEAVYRPRVSMDASRTYERSSEAGTRRFHSLGFDVSWLLFDFGQGAAQARAAGEEWLAAQQDLRTAEVDAAFAVRTAYFTLAKQIELLAVASETVRQFETHLEQVRELVRVGKRIPYDETKAQVDVGNARLAETQARNAVETAHATLATAVGIAEVVHWTPTDRAADGKRPEFDAAWAEARSRAPDIAASRAREQAASAIVDARVAALYPSLSLGAGYRRSGTDFPLPWTFHVGPSIQWTPFDGFENLATIDEAVASFRASSASRTQVEQRTWLELRTAWVAVEDARQRIAIAELVVKSAEENLELARGLFEHGKSTSVELADATQGLAEARATVVDARADLAIADARLARAMGFAERGACVCVPGDPR